jgi:hypothetical protein
MLRAHDERASALPSSTGAVPAALTPGARLGAYEILGSLGAAGWVTSTAPATRGSPAMAGRVEAAHAHALTAAREKG